MPRVSAAPVLALAFLVAVAGCATSPAGSGSRSRNVITAEEIAEIQASTAFDAVQRLRPEFLRRGRVNMSSDTQTLPIVYVDDVRYGGVDELRRIRASQVVRIEYLSGSDATTRFGTGHAGGAILVTTPGSRRPPGG